MLFVATAIATWPLHTSALRVFKTDSSPSLPSCLDIAGYPGKCMMSQSPGACYLTDGNWMCWGKGQEMSNETCQNILGADQELVGYEGACVYKGYTSDPPAEMSDLDKDLVVCTDLNYYQSQCAPVSEMWGACYVEGAVDPSAWMCIQKTADVNIDSARMGDCQTYLRGGTTDKSYSNACVFPTEKEPIYKCNTVPTFATTSMNCPPDQGHVGACFNSDETSAHWMCFDQTNGTIFTNCAYTLAPGSSKHYEGACVFENSPQYDKALTYGQSATATAATTTAVTTTAAATTAAATTAATIATTATTTTTAIETVTTTTTHHHHHHHNDWWR